MYIAWKSIDIRVFTKTHKYPMIIKRPQKMKKYNTEDYFSVRERRTGRKICDCGDFEDARMIMCMDAPNREIVKSKTLMGQVVDIVMPKALPTNEIAINTKPYQEHQDEWMVEKINQLPQIKLPDRQQEPFRV